MTSTCGVFTLTVAVAEGVPVYEDDEFRVYSKTESLLIDVHKMGTTDAMVTVAIERPKKLSRRTGGSRRDD